MVRILQIVLVLVIAPLFASVAAAGPIIYFDTYRSLNVNGTVFETTATGFWSATTGNGPNRSQNSTIGGLRIDGQGRPYELIGGSGNLNTSRFDGASTMSTNLMTSFLLDSPYTADLDAFLSANNDGQAQGFLFNETTQTMLAQVMVDEGIRRLQYEGVLDPGVYSYYLLAELNTAGGSNDHRAQFGGEFTLRPFTPVPEPATMTLFGVGLAATAWRRRRMRGSTEMRAR